MRVEQSLNFPRGELCLHEGRAVGGLFDEALCHEYRGHSDDQSDGDDGNQRTQARVPHAGLKPGMKWREQDRQGKRPGNSPQERGYQQDTQDKPNRDQQGQQRPLNPVGGRSIGRGAERFSRRLIHRGNNAPGRASNY